MSFFPQFLACNNKTDITTTIVCGLSRLLSGWSLAKYSRSPRWSGFSFYSAWEQNEQCREGNDGEAGSHSMHFPIQTYTWDAARGGAFGSLNDFLPRPIQWKAHNGEVQSLHRTAGPESLWKQCNRAPHTHRCTLLTGHNELNLLRYGGAHFVWGVTAIGSLVLCKVPIIGYHKGPRILLFHQPGV